MADPPPDFKGDSRDDTRVAPGRESTTGTPRWVKVFGIIALVVVALFVIALLGGGGGGHGPARHTSAGAPGDSAPARGVAFGLSADRTLPMVATQWS